METKNVKIEYNQIIVSSHGCYDRKFTYPDGRCFCGIVFIGDREVVANVIEYWCVCNFCIHEQGGKCYNDNSENRQEDTGLCPIVLKDCRWRHTDLGKTKKFETIG